MNQISVVKKYIDLPAAHRQHKDDGHCRFVHGHCWSFEIEFRGTKFDLDARGFLVDFGAMKDFRAWLEGVFDHTLLICHDDPELATFEEMHKKGLVDLRVIPSGCSCEGLAAHVLQEAVKWCNRHHVRNNVHVHRVTCHEDSKNSATAYST